MTAAVWFGAGGFLVGWLLRAWLAARSRAEAARAATAHADGLTADMVALGQTLETTSAERDGLVSDLATVARTGLALRVESEAQVRALEHLRGERDRATERADHAGAAERRLTERVSELEPMIPELDELRREARLLADQRTGLATRLEQLTRHSNRIDGERTHAVLLVETVERQFKQLAASTNAARSLQATELLELKRQLEASTRRQAHFDADRRAAELSHQEALAALQAELGAAQALAERALPLRRQLEDREGLVRSVASERDEATRALVHREREWIVQVADLEQNVARLEAQLQRAGSAETLLASTSRERDDFAAALQSARIEIASLTTEIKDRDLRFRALLDDRRQFAEASQDQIAHLREQSRRVGDDLKRISGIGPHLEGRLKAHGITTFRQIAEWSESDLERIAKELGPFAHRIRRDRWVEQARRECQVHGQPAA